MSAHDVAWACNAGAVIETGHGDLLASEADALVNAVNTEGVMGAGIAGHREWGVRGSNPRLADYESAALTG